MRANDNEHALMNKAELKILAIDTATEACSVALNLRGEITRRFEIAPNGHSKLVLGMAESLLQQSGLDLAQLDALAVDVGPGSFTGVRIGIGVAQGLAYGSGRKVMAVGSLETLAFGIAGEAGYETVLAAIDARMGQVYYGLYLNPRNVPGTPNGELLTLIQPALGAPEILTAMAIGNEKKTIGVGNAWDRYAPVMPETLNGPGPVVEWLAGRYPDAATVSRIAMMRGLQSAVSPLELSAAYIRDQVAETSRP